VILLRSALQSSISAFLVLTYVMLGGIDVWFGLAGLLDSAMSFYAVGAYSYALLATNFGLRSGSACRSPHSAAFWACCSVPRVRPARRLSRDRDAGVTARYRFIINWQSLTMDPTVCPGSPRPTSVHSLETAMRAAALSA